MSLKWAKGYKGYYGESCYKAHGRKFIKRFCRRSNRHFLNSQLRKFYHDTI